MDVRALDADPLEREIPLLAVAIHEDEGELRGAAAALDERLGGRVGRVRSRGDFRGKEGDTVLLYPDGDRVAPERILLVGAGKAGDRDAETLRRVAARAVRAAEGARVARLAVAVDAGRAPGAGDAGDASAVGAALAAWRYRELRTADDDPPVQVEAVELLVPGDAVDAARRGAREGAAVAEAANWARLLQARPGNVATPTHLADEATSMAASLGLESTVLDRARLEKEGLHALLAVSSGSREEPRLIVLEHRGADDDEAPLALVGKGLTFDAGGISLKPSKGMEEMKYDMSGGAGVLAAIRGVAALELPVNVVAVVPSSENLPSGSAVKPGDVIRTLEGKSVEVINTDAEGRLILADGLAWARRHRPAAMVDAATLTGSCVVALGHHAAGVMGSDETVVEELRAAGDRSGERCWPLPLWDEYREQLESEVADLKNTGGRPAGAITAGHFLKEFTGDTPWGHLDVAGTAYGDANRPYHRDGPTGFPTRLLIDWVRARTK